MPHAQSCSPAATAAVATASAAAAARSSSSQASQRETSHRALRGGRGRAGAGNRHPRAAPRTNSTWNRPTARAAGHGTTGNPAVHPRFQTALASFHEHIIPTNLRKRGRKQPSPAGFSERACSAQFTFAKFTRFDVLAGNWAIIDRLRGFPDPSQSRSKTSSYRLSRNLLPNYRERLLIANLRKISKCQYRSFTNLYQSVRTIWQGCCGGMSAFPNSVLCWAGL